MWCARVEDENDVCPPPHASERLFSFRVVSFTVNRSGCVPETEYITKVLLVECGQN